MRQAKICRVGTGCPRREAGNQASSFPLSFPLLLLILFPGSFLFRLLCFLLSVLILLFLLLPPPPCPVLSPFLSPKLFHNNGLTHWIRASARYSEHEPVSLPHCFKLPEWAGMGCGWKFCGGRGSALAEDKSWIPTPRAGQ